MRALIARHWPLLVVLAAATALYAQTRERSDMFMWDEAEYACLARSLARGDGFALSARPNHYRLPVLPLTAAASIAVAGRADDAVLTRASLAFAVLALAIVYAAVAAEHGRWTAALAAAILAVLPGFWTLSSHLLTELPFLAFFSGALFALRRGLAGDPRAWMLAGAAAALALLTRYTGVLLAPTAALIVVIAMLAGPEGVVLTWSRQIAVGAALFGALLLPWLLRQQIVFGDALIGFRYASGQLDDYVPGVAMPWSFYLAGLPHLLTLPGALLALAGAVWAVVTRDRIGVVSVVVVAFLLAWFGLYRYKELRLITAVLPFCAVLIALGLTRALFERLPARGLAVVLGFAVVAGLGWHAATTELRTSVTLGYPSFLDAMASLRQNSRDTAHVVGTAGPQIEWYADRITEPYPMAEAELPALIDRTDWFVATSFERGQPPYVDLLARAVTLVDLATRRARRFSDGRFQTLLISPDLMRELLRRQRAIE